MAIFRKIHTKFWSDPFVESLTPEKKYFYLYLLTNEKTKQCGIYEITIRQMSYDTGYVVETVNLLLDYFIGVGKIQVSRETNEIAVKNWKKYNDSRSPGVQKCITEELTKVKNRKLVQWVQSGGTVGGLPTQEEEEPEEEKESEEVGSERVKEVANEVWKDQSWKEQICMGLSITIDELKKWLALFNSSVASDKIPGFDKGKYKKMSRGWISAQKAKGTTIETGSLQKKSDSAPLKHLKP